MSNATLQADSGSAGGDVQTLTSDSGTATASGNNINVTGTGGVTTTATGDTLTIDGSGISPAFLDQQQIYYVSKAGNDSNDGLNQEVPFLTIGAAVTAATAQTPSSSNLFTIYVLDGGIYSENVSLPDFVSLFAPGATVVGRITLNDECYVQLRESSQPVSGDNFLKNSGSGDCYIWCQKVSGLETCFMHDASSTGIMYVWAQDVFGGDTGTSGNSVFTIDDNTIIANVGKVVSQDNAVIDFDTTATGGNCYLYANQIVSSTSNLVESDSILNNAYVVANEITTFRLGGDCNLYVKANKFETTGTIQASAGEIYLEIGYLAGAFNFQDNTNSTTATLKIGHWTEPGSGSFSNLCQVSTNATLYADVGYFELTTASLEGFLIDDHDFSFIKIGHGKCTNTGQHILEVAVTSSNTCHFKADFLESTSTASSTDLINVLGGTNYIDVGSFETAGSSEAWNFAGGTNYLNNKFTTDDPGDSVEAHNQVAIQRELKGIIGSFAGSEKIEKAFSVTTTLATPTDLITIPVAEDQIIKMTAEIAVIESDHTTYDSFWVRCAFKREAGGNVALVGTQIVDAADGGTYSVNAVADTGTQEATIQVTGAIGQTLNWVGYVSYFRINTAS